jgi:hypothetical protein
VTIDKSDPSDCGLGKAALANEERVEEMERRTGKDPTAPASKVKHAACYDTQVIMPVDDHSAEKKGGQHRPSGNKEVDRQRKHGRRLVVPL